MGGPGSGPRKGSEGEHYSKTGKRPVSQLKKRVGGGHRKSTYMNKDVEMQKLRLKEYRGMSRNNPKARKSLKNPIKRTTGKIKFLQGKK